MAIRNFIVKVVHRLPHCLLHIISVLFQTEMFPFKRRVIVFDATGRQVAQFSMENSIDDNV